MIVRQLIEELKELDQETEVEVITGYSLETGIMDIEVQDNGKILIVGEG